MEYFYAFVASRQALLAFLVMSVLFAGMAVYAELMLASKSQAEQILDRKNSWAVPFWATLSLSSLTISGVLADAIAYLVVLAVMVVALFIAARAFKQTVAGVIPCAILCAIGVAGLNYSYFKQASDALGVPYWMGSIALAIALMTFVLKHRAQRIRALTRNGILPL